MSNDTLSPENGVTTAYSFSNNKQNPLAKLRNMIEYQTAPQQRELMRRLLDEYLREIEQTHMRLPVDADGVPIHIGDMLLKSTGAQEASYGEVVGLSDDSVWFDAKNGWEANWSHLTRHVKPDTVESLLEEFQHDTLTTQGEYAGEVIDADEWRRDLKEHVEEYAERIRKAVEQ